jgi:ABC-type antimicrobial peptide transport system permease subunit
MSLGAQRRDVLRQVLLEGMAMVTIGLALGLCGAVAATRLIKNFLYDVAATDLASFAGAALLLAGVALLANYLPARRAASVDPLLALRRE